MNRRVTFVTALSAAGTAAVAAISFAIVYEPADDPSAGVPLLDAVPASGADPLIDGAVPLVAAPLPTSLDPAAPIAATAVADTAAARPPDPSGASGQGGRPTGTPPAAPAGSTPPATVATPGVTTGAAPGTAPTTSGANQPPMSTVTTATTVTPGAPVATTPPVTTAPATTAPTPPTTAAARPEGVPADWPANQPIPPMPAGCVQPQLEDSGVWNCQH